MKYHCLKAVFFSCIFFGLIHKSFGFFNGMLQAQKVKQLNALNDASLSNDAETDVTTEVNLKDWRSYRAKLIKNAAIEGYGEPRNNWDENCWAHSIGTIETGCLLLANESLQGTFSKTAVLIVEHSAENGTLGLILNKPTKRRFSSEPGLGEKLKMAFGMCTVYYGGPVGQNSITTLHNVDESKESEEVIPHIYMGGLEELIHLGSQGKIKSSRLRLTMGHAAWEPGQLERELDANFWYVAAASPQVMVANSEREVSKMWHKVLDLMGGPYALIAKKNK